MTSRDSFTGNANHQVAKPVVNILILIDGKIPVLRRSKNGDTWHDLPGGKPEPEDATLAHTALRELMEEIGVEGQVAHDDPVDVMPHPHIEGAHKVFMKCTHVSGEPRNCLTDEHEALLLLEPPEAVKLLGPRISPKVGQILLDMAGAASQSQGAKPRKPFG